MKHILDFFHSQVAEEYNLRSGEKLSKKQARNRWVNTIVKEASQVQSNFKKSKKITGGGKNTAPAPSDLQSKVLDTARSISVDFPRDYDQESAAFKERKNAKRSLQDDLESNEQAPIGHEDDIPDFESPIKVKRIKPTPVSILKPPASATSKSSSSTTTSSTTTPSSSTPRGVSFFRSAQAASKRDLDIDTAAADQVN